MNSLSEQIAHCVILLVQTHRHGILNCRFFGDLYPLLTLPQHEKGKPIWCVGHDGGGGVAV